MTSNIIFTDILNNYKPIIWAGNEIYKYSSQLKNFLTQQLGKEYADLFAEPFVSEQTSKIRWLSDCVSNKAQRLTQLSDFEQNKAKQKLKILLLKIDEFAQSLINSDQEDAVKWGQIIQKATDIPSLDYVFVEKENIIITAWGFSTNESIASNFKLKKEILKEKPIIEDIPPVENIIEQKEKPIVANETKNTQTQEPQEKKEKTKNKKSLYKKWWFWLILFALLLLILYFLFFNRNQYLPIKEGKIPPIDTTKIVKDPNGRTVISDELILYIGARNKSVEQLAKDFKRLYPAKKYKIIYFNTKGAKRINIQFPASEKNAIKKNLKAKLSDYNLVIVDEAIFTNEIVPNDPGFSDIHKYWAYQDVKAFSAWNVTEGNPNIIVAIIDNGFDLTQPEFAGKIVKPFNIPAGNTNPNIGQAKVFHGTHVAATAIGNIDNSQGLCGIAPKCSFMPIQVGDQYGRMSTTAIIDGVFYAIENGANVVNMSLGMPALKGMENMSQDAQEEFIKNTYKDDEKLWDQIFKVADQNNVTFVLAAGNDDVLVGLDPMQRSPNTIKVSAVDPLNKKASFSNYGQYSTISAPGVQIFSALPNDKFGFLQGTSMAAPIVTGGVALLKSINPNLSNQEIIQILQKTGKPLRNTSKHIGNLIQLSVALGNYNDSLHNNNNDECTKIQEKIDSLQNEIEILKNKCHNQQDTSSENLVIPENPKNLKFASGVWKSTTDLFNSVTDEPVELYFKFDQNGTGEVTFVEKDGNKCYADLKVSLDKNKLNFEQTGEALCQDANTYKIYKYVCKSENNEEANCIAKTSENNKVIEFKLKKIR